MADERADPVTTVLAQHRVAIYIVSMHIVSEIITSNLAMQI